MLKRDVTQSTVIITIAVCIGMIVCSQSVSLNTHAQASPPFKEWKWENMTVLLRHDLVVRMGKTFEIRNSTIIMDSTRRTIGIRVLGLLSVSNSTIKRLGKDGYYFEVFGVADIEDSRIEGMKSIDPIGEGMIVSPRHFQIRNSTVSSVEEYAITFYYPLITMIDFIVNSDIAGVSLVKSVVNAKNSTLGDLHFRYGPGEFHLYNCSYTSTKVERAAFGHIFSWRYLQAHTSLPESYLTITSVDEQMVDKVITDENGDFAFWWPSKWMMLDPMPDVFVVDNNPFTFQANKTVFREFVISGRGGDRRVAIAMDYYGETVQDLEESAMVEVVMEPAPPVLRLP